MKPGREFAARRIANVPKTTVWHEFTPLAIQHKAVNLGQGFPTWAPPHFVSVNAARAALDSEPLGQQYARAFGHLRLVNALQRDYTERFQRDIGLENILVVNGTTQGLSVAFQSICSEGDEVILFEPFFDVYINDIEMAGGIPKVISLVPGKTANDWHVPEGVLEAAITPKTKAILLNTPMNVPGKVWSRKELQRICDVAIANDLFVVADEVYQHLVYDGCEHLHIATFPGMWDRTVTLCSAGKTFTVTGWKIGWMIAPGSIIVELGKTFAHQCFSVATPLQVAVAASLEQARELKYYPELVSQYLHKREMLCNMLTELGLSPVIPQGSFFVLADISHIDPSIYVDPADTSVAHDWHFCRWLTKTVGVTAIPVTAFCQRSSHPQMQRFVRFAFCKTEEAILEAGKRMKECPVFAKHK